MKVLDKEEKAIYDGLMEEVDFKFIDCRDVEVPESWKKIKVAKFE